MRISREDADKQRPYYGRGLVLLARVSREIGVNDAWCGWVARVSREIGVNDAWCGWVARVSREIGVNDAWCGRVARVSREFDVRYGLVWVNQGAPAPGPVPIPNHQADLALGYAENDIPHPPPVHSRDAACPRPPSCPHITILSASCTLLDARWHPATSSLPANEPHI